MNWMTVHSPGGVIGFCRKSGCICPSCVRKMVNVYLNSRIRKGFTPITYPSPVPIGMIRKDILMDIGFAEFASLFHIGKVYDEKHCLSDDFFSFVSKHPEKEVRITGGDTSSVNVCQSCNRVLYFPLPLSEWHIEDLNRQCFFILLFGQIRSLLMKKRKIHSKTRDIKRFQW